MQFSKSEWMFYGGLLIAGIAAILAVIALVGFLIYRRHLHIQLTKEYGKKRH